ncbi:MAG: hypothetical protein ACRECZ_06050, partial [Methylocella sp.]
MRRKFFFAISLAIPHPFLSLPDAHLPQFAQKVGTLVASMHGSRAFSFAGVWRLRALPGCAAAFHVPPLTAAAAIEHFQDNKTRVIRLFSRIDRIDLVPISRLP